MVMKPTTPPIVTRSKHSAREGAVLLTHVSVRVGSVFSFLDLTAIPSMVPRNVNLGLMLLRSL